MNRSILSVLMACSLPLMQNPPVNAQVVDALPTVTRTVGGRVFKLPDFSRLSWDSMPPASTPGYINVAPAITKQLGFDPSRSWKVGQKPASYTMLADTEEVFGLGKKSLNDIAKLSTLPLNGGISVPQGGTTLADFGVIKKQTISTLLKAIPQLGNFDVSQVPPIRDLLAMNGMQASSGALAALVEQNPTLGDLPLKQLDLSQYNLDSIPGGLLSTTPLEAFNGYQETFVSEIPGLKMVSFAKLAPQFFGETFDFQFFALADLYWGNTGSSQPAEHGDPNVGPSQFVSGRVTCSGKNVPVAPKTGTAYGYIELTNTSRSGAYYGSRWASGLDQDVNGGCGLLGKVNGGKEPTGRLVYGTDVLKIVLDQVDQGHETATFRANTHICAHLPFGQKTCTPYCFSALPWLSVSGQNWVQIGRGSL